MSTAERFTAAPAPVPTPCLGICDIDPVSGYCRGCARTGDEVAAWAEAQPDYKSAVWDELPTRRTALTMNAYRLPWSADDIAAMIERTLRRRWGRWVLGLQGASASFEIGPDEDTDIISRPDLIMAITARGAMRLLKHPKTIAVAFGSAADETGPDAIGLILPRGRVNLPEASVLTAAGSDIAAIASCGEAQLYDLGLAPRLASRFCLRTADYSVLASLKAHEGMHWQNVSTELMPAIAETRMHHVVETGIGRIESFAPPADDAWPTEVGSLQELPDDWALPRVFAPCALFYPYSRKRAEALLDGHF